MPERDSFVQEFLRLEAPEPRVPRTCPGCHTAPALYRCHQCFDERIYCRACVVTAHQVSPFHEMEVSDGL